MPNPLKELQGKKDNPIKIAHKTGYGIDSSDPDALRFPTDRLSEP